MPAEADRGDRADGHWPAELCQYVGHKDHGAEKRICGLSEPWHDKRTAAVAFAHRGPAPWGSFDRDPAAGDLLCDLVWDADGFFTA